jgi:hypothetical protein
MKFFASDFSGMGSLQARLFEYGFELCAIVYGEDSILPIMVSMGSL